MMQIWSLLCFYFLTEEFLTAEKKCWEMNDVRSKKDEFIGCQKSVIVVKDLEFHPEGSISIFCARIQQLQKCNGLYGVCDKHNIDIFAIIEEVVDKCYYGKHGNKPLTVCIVFECVPGEVNTLMDSTTLTKARGSLYQALQLKGFLRCSIHGHISNITVFKSPSAISLREENGTEVLFQTLNSYRLFYKYTPWNSKLFSYTSDYNGNAIEITVESTDAKDVFFKIEGGKYYRCQRGINTQQHDVFSSTNGGKYYRCQRGINTQQHDVFSSTNDGDKCHGFSKELLPWVATVLSTLLFLVLIGVYVGQCQLQRKKKQVSMKAKSPPDPSSRRPINNDYESPHLYMDVAV